MDAYSFYGWEHADVPALDDRFFGILTPRDLYDALSVLWCAETCAPRLRSGWTKDDPTRGQCSVTAFLAQDLFGGKVYGVPRPDGNIHCYNVVGDCVFDLTDGQFHGEKLCYEHNPEQFRAQHFAKEEKRQRYELLRAALVQFCQPVQKNPAPPQEMETARLILRKWRDSDADDLFFYAKDPDVGPIAGWQPHQNVQESRDVIRNVLSGPACFAVCRKADGRPVGCIELRLCGNTDLTDRADECELGYWLGKPFWGQGMMPEAAEAVLRYAFEELAMRAVWCGYYDGNAKSKRVQEKLHFVYHHTCDDVPVPLMHETRVGHTNCMSRIHWRVTR